VSVKVAGEFGERFQPVDSRFFFRFALRRCREVGVARFDVPAHLDPELALFVEAQQQAGEVVVEHKR